MVLSFSTGPREEARVLGNVLVVVGMTRRVGEEQAKGGCDGV